MEGEDDTYLVGLLPTVGARLGTKHRAVDTAALCSGWATNIRQLEFFLCCFAPRYSKCPQMITGGCELLAGMMLCGITDVEFSGIGICWDLGMYQERKVLLHSPV